MNNLSSWECKKCRTENSGNDTKCKADCGGKKPEEAPMKQIPLAKSPIQLFSTRGDVIILNDNNLQILIQKFSPNQPMVIWTVAGLLGTGKSSWLNSLAALLRVDVEVGEMFEVGHTIQTQTEGIWAYPVPLRCQDYPNVQILLLDTEGMESIKKDEGLEVTKKALKKLYTTSMILSSVFIIHTHFRLDQTTITTLMDAFEIIQHLKDKVDIEIPQIILMVKDRDKIEMKDPEESMIKFVTKECKLGEELAKRLKAYAKPLPSQAFHQAMKSGNLKELRDSDMKIRKFNETFIKENMVIKTVPGFNGNMIPSHFRDLTIVLKSIINAEEFDLLFKRSMDSALEQIVAKAAETILAQFRGEAEVMAKNFPEEKSVDEFQKQFDEFKSHFIQLFMQKIEKDTRRKIDGSEMLQSELAKFRVRLNIKEFEQMFVMRKMEKASAEEKTQLQGQLEKLKEDGKIKEQAIKNLEEKQAKGAKESDEKIILAIQEMTDRLLALESNKNPNEEMWQKMFAESQEAQRQWQKEMFAILSKPPPPVIVQSPDPNPCKIM